MFIRRCLPRGLILGAAATLLAGCAQYQPAPIDRAALETEFLARLPDTPLADRLIAATPGLDGDATAPFDLADGLSAREAEIVALIQNPRLRVARARLGVAQARADFAGLWDDPVLGADVIRYFNTSESLWQWSAALSLTLPISGRLEAEKARAGAERTAEVLRVAADEWEVRIEVRDAWIRWSATRARIELLDALLATTDGILRNVERLEAAGELSRVEASLFRIERASRLAERRLAETDARTAEIGLRTALGLAPDAPLALTPSFDAPVAHALASAGDRRLRDNPTLAVAEAAYEVAEKGLALEVRRQYPDLTIGPGGGDDQGDSNVLLGVSLPLPLWNRNQLGVAEATARRDVARRELEAEVESRLGALAAAVAALEGATAERLLVESELIPLTDSEIADATRLAALGEMNIVVLVDAVTRQLDAHLARLAAREREARAAFAILRLTGPAPLLPSAPEPLP